MTFEFNPRTEEIAEFYETLDKEKLNKVLQDKTLFPFDITNETLNDLLEFEPEFIERILENEY